MTELEELKESNRKVWGHLLQLQEQVLRLQAAMIQLQELQLDHLRRDNA